MKKKLINIIVALDKFGGYSKNGEIPWINEPFAKDDLKRFQKLTMDNIVIMGRHTYEDIAKISKKTNILPNRTCFILSRSGFKLPKDHEDRLMVKPDLRACFNIINFDDKLFKKKVFVIGGGKVFTEALAYYIDTIYVTLVEKDWKCDNFFPISIFKKYKIKNGKELCDGVKFLEYSKKIQLK